MFCLGPSRSVAPDPYFLLCKLPFARYFINSTLISSSTPLSPPTTIAKPDNAPGKSAHHPSTWHLTGEVLSS